MISAPRVFENSTRQSYGIFYPYYRSSPRVEELRNDIPEIAPTLPNSPVAPFMTEASHSIVPDIVKFEPVPDIRANQYTKRAKCLLLNKPALKTGSFSKDSMAD
jgi:hypothetical protein